jgi:hypothetical protein
MGRQFTENYEDVALLKNLTAVSYLLPGLFS